MHFRVFGLFFASSALSAAAAPLLSLILGILPSPALVFYHSVCLSLYHFSHSFMSDYIIFYLMHSGLFGHLRVFSLIGIQREDPLAFIYSCTFGFYITFSLSDTTFKLIVYCINKQFIH